jgi:hypothetical protein
MELVLKIVAAVAALLVGLSLFPGLSWLLKIRITACALLGMLVLGIWAWPVVAPQEPFSVVKVPAATGFIELAALAAATGFAAYFLAWPYGAHIGVVAVLAGMAVWAARSGSIAEVVNGTAGAAQRIEFFRSLLVQPLLWLAVAGAGFAGVLLGRLVLAPQASQPEPKPKAAVPANMIAAFFASSVIAFFFVTLLAQDVRIPDERLGHVIAQPSAGQIGFAAFVAFGVAAFVVRQFLGAGYIWPVLGTAAVSVFGLAFYDRASVTEYMTANWPGEFFASSHAAILPLQMVSFGILGAIAGYWLVESFQIWRREQDLQA